jgi:uncharacterized protein YhhL (DUF1145 family)
MPEHTPHASSITPAGCLLRLIWLVAGSGTLFLTLAVIAVTRAPLPSYLDAIVVVTAVSMIAVRRIEIARFGGRTLADEPASLVHWRRYVVMLLGSILAGWTLAHAIAGSLAR